MDQFSSYDYLKRVTAWTLRFNRNSQTKNIAERIKTHLTTTELQAAENYWLFKQLTSQLTWIHSKENKLSPTSVHYCLCNHLLMILIFSE